MGLFFIFSVDGDWGEYFLHKLSQDERKPDKKIITKLIKQEMRVAQSLDNKLLHFVHTSQIAYDFFLKPEFLRLWREMEKKGGSVGVHCHNEHLFCDGRITDKDEMDTTISNVTTSMRKEGLKPISYRGGYLAFCEDNIPILEKNNLFLDFSCETGRYLWHEERLISDWYGAPDNYYRMSYTNYRKPGKSRVIEIPLGKDGYGPLYPEVNGLISMWKTVRYLVNKDKEQKRDVIVSVLSHTYDYSSFWMRLKIRITIFICKKYGKFINDKEALGIIEEAEGVKGT